MHPLRRHISLIETAQARLLTEMDWYDMAPMADLLRKHPGKFVHFSRVNKLGVNPQKRHDDPHGIYFYPTDWFFAQKHERVAEFNQWGLNWPYYFIVDIDMSAPGVTLSKITWQQVEEIATRNGWKQHLDDFRAEPPEKQASVLPSYIKPDHPGFFLWHFVEKLASDVPGVTWNGALKGLAYVYDDNNGIIHRREPHQIVVLDPRCIRMVESGSTKALDDHDRWDKWEHWQPAIVAILQHFADRYGGRVTWKDKRPTATFTVQGKRYPTTFTLAWSDSSWGNKYLTLKYRYGRAEGSASITSGEMRRDLTRDDVIARLQASIGAVLQHDRDLEFEPLVPLEELQEILHNRVGDGGDFAWDVEIQNDAETPRYSRAWVRGTRKQWLDGVYQEFYLVGSVGIDEVSITINNKIGDVGLSVSQADGASMDEAMAKAQAQVIENSKWQLERISPAAKTSWQHSKFYDEGEYRAFLGWLALKCGVSLDGAVQDHFRDEIAAYRAFEQKDGLHSTIAYVLKPR